MTFGDRLRAARKQNKLTQKELAAKINAAHNSISNWENNQNMPDPDTIQNLCWALDVQPNYFFGEPETKNAPTFRERVESELDDYSVTFLELAKDLSDENKEKLLELARLFKLDQERKQRG